MFIGRPGMQGEGLRWLSPIHQQSLQYPSIMLSINARDFNNTAFQVREPGVLALIAVSGVLWQPAQREITFQYSLQGRFNSSQLQGWRLPLPCKGRAVGRGLSFVCHGMWRVGGFAAKEMARMIQRSNKIWQACVFGKWNSVQVEPMVFFS